ncbi:hypothetical protein AtNW77_Chr1g0003681 [Arabidopsis thaliana]
MDTNEPVLIYFLCGRMLRVVALYCPHESTPGPHTFLSCKFIINTHIYIPLKITH